MFALLAGVGMASLDSAIANIALPTIAKELDASAARNAPPAPCRNRNSTSQVSERDSAQASEARPNATMPNA